MINEAIFDLQDGKASAEDIDKPMQLGANQPMGPLATADLIGNDTVLHIMNILYQETGDTKYRPAMLLKNMVRGGLLGRKTGRGFFKY
jgi:3-hydroxybutyryl-CoA dehydrogenase